MVSATANPLLRRNGGPSLFALLALALLTFGAVWSTVRLSGHAGPVAAIWFANAICLVFLLRQRRRYWYQLLITAAVANMFAFFLVGDTPVAAVVYTICNIGETLAVAIPMRVFRVDRAFTRPSALLIFYALAGGPAPLVGAFSSAAYMYFTQDSSFWSATMLWYGADALGLCILVPPLMTVDMASLKAMFRRDQCVHSLLLIGVVLAVIGINWKAPSYPLAFLFFPAVVLLTFQRGFAGGAIGLALSAGYLVAPVLLGNATTGLREHSVREQLIIVEIFVAVISFTVILIGAALEERRRLERGLAAAIGRAENSREEALVAKDAAENASRSKSMFLANMSHELRTPLNAVIGFAQLMRGEMFGPLGDARYREYAGVIQDAGQHLLALINDILDMSKIEAGKFELNRERVSVGAVVSECAALMHEQAAQGQVNLSVNLPPEPLFALADRRAMKQIALNLLSNAVKFTPAGGRVDVSVGASGGVLRISVRDTGMGIPADQLARIGNPFVQLRNSAGSSQPGTGLGLALVRALAEMHNGRVQIESVEGQGTTVSVEIPAIEAESVAA